MKLMPEFIKVEKSDLDTFRSMYEELSRMCSLWNDHIVEGRRYQVTDQSGQRHIYLGASYTEKKNGLVHSYLKGDADSNPYCLEPLPDGCLAIDGAPYVHRAHAHLALSTVKELVELP